MPTETLPTRYVPLDDVTESPTNVKAHDVDLIVASIRRFGFADPLVVDQRTDELLSGHGRTAALRRMRDAGEPPPDGIVEEDGAWHVPVYQGWSSTNDAEADAARVALNRTSEVGGWDEAELLGLLDRLGEIDHGLDGLGYVDEDLDVLRRRLEALGEIPVDPQAEWAAAGMPEYEQNDLESEFRATIHFPSEEDADRFFALIGTTRKRSLWWPENDGHKGCDVNEEWVAAETADA